MKPVSRLGLGKGKPYSVELCIRFIRTMFSDLWESLDPSTLKNLKVASANDKIRIERQAKTEYHSIFQSQKSKIPSISVRK